jgi:WhiB family transcriptional regulator, redox-sensing transcriptional regulator
MAKRADETSGDVITIIPGERQAEALRRLQDGYLPVTISRATGLNSIQIRALGETLGLEWVAYGQPMRPPVPQVTILTLAPMPADYDVYEDDEEEPDWRDFALCAQTDPEAFFPEKGGSTREAKKVCRACEVRAQCLEYALETGERHGIWGGLSGRERRRLLRAAS